MADSVHVGDSCDAKTEIPVAGTRRPKCQSHVPDGYPPRMPGCPATWGEVDANPGAYTPTSFTSHTVHANERGRPGGKGWADPPRAGVSSLWGRYTTIGGKRRRLAEAVADNAVAVDGNTGRLRGPVPTGMTGRGLLGKWGPNPAADPIVTRHAPGTGALEFLSIVRADGSLAFPGGMVDDGRSVPATLRAELTEEAVSEGAVVDRLFSECERGVVYAGWVDDPRNTDEAWMETTATWFHATPEVAEGLVLKVSDESEGIRSVQWTPVASVVGNAGVPMYASHKDWLEMVCAKVGLTSTSTNKPATPQEVVETGVVCSSVPETRK